MIKLSKVRISYSGVQLSDAKIKNVIGGPNDVNCDSQASEGSCNGACYSGTY